jgi:hypothetical protein
MVRIALNSWVALIRSDHKRNAIHEKIFAVLRAIIQAWMEEKVQWLANWIGAAVVVFDIPPLLGPGAGESSPPVGSPYTTVTVTVFPQTLAGAKLDVVRPTTLANKTPNKNCLRAVEPRFLFISSSNFPAGEGSGRGRPAAIPWPGARVRIETWANP